MYSVPLETVDLKESTCLLQQVQSVIEQVRRERDWRGVCLLWIVVSPGRCAYHNLISMSVSRDLPYRRLSAGDPMSPHSSGSSGLCCLLPPCGW